MKALSQISFHAFFTVASDVHMIRWREPRAREGENPSKDTQQLLVETGYPWSSLKEPSVSSGCLECKWLEQGFPWNGVVGQGREDPWREVC